MHENIRGHSKHNVTKTDWAREMMLLIRLSHLCIARMGKAISRIHVRVCNAAE